MLGLLCILSLFRNEFNTCNNTGARMLDSIYHLALTLLTIRVFNVKNVQDFVIFYETL